VAGVGGRFASAEAAEAAFYDAFEGRDLEAMMAVWDDGDAVVCVHPVGQRLEGKDAIRQGWQAIFGADRPLRLTIGERRCMLAETLAVHVVHEHITTGRDPVTHPPVIATNVYRLTAGGWRMVLHHASPTPAPAPVRQAAPPAQRLH